MSSNFWYLNSNLWGRGWRKNAILMLILFKTNELKKTCKSEIVNLSYSPWKKKHLYFLFLLLDPCFHRDFGKQYSCSLNLTINATVYNCFNNTGLLLQNCRAVALALILSFSFIYLYVSQAFMRSKHMNRWKITDTIPYADKRKKTCLKVRL